MRTVRTIRLNREQFLGEGCSGVPRLDESGALSYVVSCEQLFLGKENTLLTYIRIASEQPYRNERTASVMRCLFWN